MTCTQCGATLIEGKPFCASCGSLADFPCPRCTARVRPEFQFCPDCGFALGEAARATAPQPTPEPERAPPPETPAPSPGFDELARTLAFSEAPASVGPTAERKQVTVVFCDLVGSTSIAESMDPEEYRDLLDGYLELAIAGVHRMEGVVNQLAGDGLMALFGAPVAHEDAPQNAVNAALGIHRDLERYNRERAGNGGVELRARIGIHTGPVVVGTVGNEFKTDYTATGDTTNLASRLQSLARPGTVLISDATQRLVEGQFEFESRGSIAVDGRREPVQGFEVLGPVASVSPLGPAVARGLTPLVGVDQELAQLEACFDRVEGGLPQLVSVVSETGSGKSRLIYEFKQRLRERNAVVFEARGSSVKRSVPFAPIGEILRQYFEIEPSEGSACACDKVDTKLRLEGLDTPDQELYTALCQLVTSGTEREGGPSPHGERERSLGAVAHLLGELSTRGPVVVIVEDLHWVDEASLELLEAAVSADDEKSAVMLVVTHRPDFRLGWNSNGTHTQLKLRPLRDSDAEQIVRTRAGGELPAELVQRIIERADGNPFFLEELTRGLVEQGLIVADASGVRVTRALEDVAIPGTVQELISARLDRLSAGAKRAAQVAAVIGRQFHAGQLGALLDGEGIDLASELRELEDRGIIHRKSQLDGESYRFGESLTQEVAYESLLLRQRRQLHERIGAMLEDELEGSTSERAGLIAHHLARSENRQKAIASLLHAASTAMDLPSYPNAMQLYREAWRLAEQALEEGADPDLNRSAILDATRGIAGVAVLYTEEHRPEQESAVARGIEIAEELDDREALARLLGLQGMLILNGATDRFDEAVALIEQSMEVAEVGGFAVQVASTKRALAMTRLMDGQIAPAEKLIDESMQTLAEVREENPDLYLSTLQFHALVALYGDDLDGAVRRGENGYEQALAVDNRTLQAGCAALLARAHYLMGDHAEALRWGRSAYEVGHAIGSAGSARSGATIELAAQLELGEAPNPARFLEQVDGDLAPGADFSLSSDLIIEVLLRLGELERARRYTDKAAGQGGGRQREALGALTAAHVARYSGASEWRASRRGYERAGELAHASGLRSIEIAALLGGGTLAFDRGADDFARKLLEAAARRAEELGFGLYVDQAQRLLNQLPSPEEARAD